MIRSVYYQNRLGTDANAAKRLTIWSQKSYIANLQPYTQITGYIMNLSVCPKLPRMEEVMGKNVVGKTITNSQNFAYILNQQAQKRSWIKI